ncbi:TetR/AcrR family transcriptional regulator [Hyunsoonleella pacifica]|uniref:TetR family transcriptional regulator n=1 Tax=Hyunsoonleella pacifica TaxID=1080224 RepID=A0A4Q9FQD3_9FLAO|nr:TetR/AcrR family transcriptional regulator [Hyunsoonleella pacifica]TBN17560.1 TetR family transcriptional regulator [Hyunsoonleella pacifica]GGD10903.1 TetR family transcriptional regulator [Hyunsoonleella pacifica]
MKKEAIDNILAIGTDLILKNGYHSVGLNKVLQEANIPKGSFYYYFKSKEDFGLQVIKHYSEKSLIVLKSYLEDDTKNHKQRIVSFFKDMQEVYTAKEFKEGCLLGNCSTELADFSASFSILIASELSIWERCFEKCIEEGQINGHIKKLESPKVLSNLILTTWEGALLRMKSEKHTESIETFILYLEKYLI